MKNIKNYLFVALAAVLSAGIFSCTEEAPAYEPAAKPTTAEVFFSSELASSYEVRNMSQFSVPVSRIDSVAELTVPVKATCDATIFTAPASVTFKAGQATADYVISINEEAIELNTPYEFSLEIGEQTTEYGVNSYAFTAMAALPWIKFATGHMTEGWWGEEEDETMYYQQITETLRYCYITNCFDTEGAATPTNYYFYWDTETNFLSIPMQYMGYTNGDGYKVYFGDGAAFYEAYYGLEYLHDKGFADGADFLYNYYGDPRPYYDGNGGFYLADYFFFDPAGDKAGKGYQFGGDMDVFIAEGFTRKDYTVSVAYNGKCFDKDNNPGIMASVIAGPDVENVKVALCVKGEEEACLNGILTDSVAYAETTGGMVIVPFNEEPVNGKYSLVAVSFGGDEAQEVATASFNYENTVAQETWTEIGTGDYTYHLLWYDGEDEEGNPIPAVDKGLTLSRSDINPYKYMISNWGGGVNFTFTMLPTGSIIVDEQEVGADYQAGDPIMVADLVDYTGGKKYGESSYDAATGTYSFALLYFCSAGQFGHGIETFVLSDDEEAEKAAQMRFATGVQKNSRVKRAFDLVEFNGNL